MNERIYWYSPDYEGDEIVYLDNPSSDIEQLIYTGLDNGSPATPYAVLEIGRSTWEDTETDPTSLDCRWEDTWENVLARVLPENIVEVSVTRRATSTGAYELGAVASSEVSVSLRYDESEGDLLPFSLNGLKMKVYFGYNTEDPDEVPNTYLVPMGKYIIDGTTLKRGVGSLSFKAYDSLSMDVLDKEMILTEPSNGLSQSVKVQEEYGDTYLSPTGSYLPYEDTPYDSASKLRIFLSNNKQPTGSPPLGLGIPEFYYWDDLSTCFLHTIYSTYESAYSDDYQKAMNVFLPTSPRVKDWLVAIAASSAGVVMTDNEGNICFRMPKFEGNVGSILHFTPDDYYTFELTSAYEEDINSAFAEVEDTENNEYPRVWYEIEHSGVPIAYGGDYVGYDVQTDVRREESVAILGKRIFSEGWSEAVDGRTHDPYPIQYNAFVLELSRQIWLEPLDRIAVTDNRGREYNLTPFTVEYRFGGGFRTILSAERYGNILESIYVDTELSPTSQNLLANKSIMEIADEGKAFLEDMLGITIE